MLMHDLPGEPITSDHYVTGTWVWQEWALSIGLAVCGLLVIAWVVTFLIRWLQKRWDDLGGWVTILAALLAIAVTLGGLWLFSSQFYDIIGHVPANSYRGKAGWVFLALIPAGAALWLAVREPVHALLMALEDDYDERFADIISLAIIIIPIIQCVWLMIATIPVWGPFTVVGVLVVTVVGVIFFAGWMMADRK